MVGNRHLLENAVQIDARRALFLTWTAQPHKTVADRKQCRDVLQCEGLAFGSQPPAIAGERQQRKIGVRQHATYNVPYS